MKFVEKTKTYNSSKVPYMTAFEEV